MVKWFKTKWHWFWYKHFLFRSATQLKQQNGNDKDFTKMLYHGVKVNELDPTGLTEFTKKLVNDSFGSGTYEKMNCFKKEETKA